MDAVKTNLRVFLIIAAFLLLASTASFIIVRNSINTPPVDLADQTQPTPTPTPTPPSTTAAAQTVVYGRWLGGSSEIRAVNADATFDSLIARLPLTIKDVNIISSTYLLYIADTNTADHGQRIALYNVNSRQEQTLTTAAPGWGIDDVIVSPDKSWIAWWEVKLGPDGKLLGGLSRVFTLLLSLNSPNPLNSPNLIFDETAAPDTPIHYPLFFDHGNNLYADGFIPNGGGWNRGLTRTTPTGQDPTTVLADGTYNSDPLLAPAQNIIAYTGTRMTATALSTAGRIQNFFGLASEATPPGIMRITAIVANELLLLDLTTNQQTPLPAEPGREYFDPVWDSNGQYLYVKSFARQDGKLTDGRFLKINVATLEVEQLDAENQPPGLQVAHSPDGFISGIPAETEVPANLGVNYAPQLLSISVGTAANPTTLVSDTSQFIGLIDRPAGQQLAFATTLPEQKADSLKLATFNPKPEIAQRTIQQNDPPDGKIRCRDLWKQLCGVDLANPGGSTRDEIKECRQKAISSGYKCYDSPLYLYPTQPTQVVTKIKNAVILAANPPYDPNHGWKVTAYPDGTLRTKSSDEVKDTLRTKSSDEVKDLVLDKVLDKIDYSYSSSFTPPTNGFIFSHQELPAKLRWYALQLGLAGREIDDFVTFWTTELPVAPYYFVSHFVNPSKIMDFAITPKPDSFIQAIMYFKPLEAADSSRALPMLCRDSSALESDATLSPPDFPSVPARTGFTAVDWSGIIDH